MLIMNEQHLRTALDAYTDRSAVFDQVQPS